MAPQRGAIEEPGPSSSRNHTVKRGGRDDRGDDEDPAEHAVALVVAGRAAQQPPQVVQPRRHHEREDQRSESPRNAAVMPRNTLPVAVVELRADHIHADGLRTPQAEHDERLEQQHRGGQQASTRRRGRAAALGRRAVADRRRPGRRPMNRPPVSVGSLRGTSTVWPGRHPGQGVVDCRLQEGGRRCPSSARRPLRPVADERAARRDLCEQIARLERELGADARRRVPAPRAGAPRPLGVGPGRPAAAHARAARADPRRARRPVEALRATRGAALLAADAAAPERHRWVRDERGARAAGLPVWPGAPGWARSAG